MISSFLYQFGILTIMIVYLLSACGNQPAVATETWTLVKILTQRSDVVSTTEIVDVRNCCGIVERKTVFCSAGTSSELNVNIGANIGVQGGGQLAIDPSVGISLGISRDNGESLELAPPLANHIHRYKVTKTYSMITGDALLHSTNGGEQTTVYRFQARCSLRIEPSTEILTCEEICPATEEEITTTPSSTDMPIPIPSPQFFEEDFSSISTMMQRWEINQNGGQIIQVEGGIRLEQGKAGQYPFLISRNNPFPENGDFDVEISIRYERVASYGTGIALSICCEENAQIHPQFEEVQPKTLLTIWQDSIYGMTILERNYGARFEFHYFLGQGNSSLKLMQILIKYRETDNNAIVFVDGQEITTVTATQRPNRIWIGNPYLVEPGEWSILEIENIRVMSQ